MPTLGAFAQATLKAAVINAENRNRLTEEDKCWREKNTKQNLKRSYQETTKTRKRPETIPDDRIQVTRIKSKRNIDKWDNDGYFENNPEDIGPAPPPSGPSGSTDRYKFFAAAPPEKKPHKKSRERSRSRERHKKKKKKSKKRKRHSSD